MSIKGVYSKTLNDHKKAVFFWTLGVILIGLLYAFLYPAVGGSNFKQAFEGMPSGFDAFIGSVDFFTTPNGFIHGEFFALTMPMIVCILSIVVGSGLLAKEEESGTIELILSRPISRAKIVRDKFLGMLSVVAIIGLGIWLGLLFGRLAVSQFQITLPSVALATFNLCLLGLTFGSLAFMLSTFKNRRSLAAGITGVYFILSYIIGTFGQTVNWLGHFSKVSLFNYYQTADILQNRIHWLDFLVLIIICAIAYLLSVRGFSQRDTNSH
jgi:ABC-2 type transport system permease protein